MKLDLAVKKLRQAAARLDAPGGRIARRNARAAVAAAMRAIRTAVDAEFPPIRKISDHEAKRWDYEVYRKMTPDQRRERKARRAKARNDRLESRGFVRVPQGRSQILVDCAAAGVRVALGAENYPWVKEWVLHVRPGDIATLRRANRSPLVRKALMAETMLREQVRREDGSLPDW